MPKVKPAESSPYCPWCHQESGMQEELWARNWSAGNVDISPLLGMPQGGQIVKKSVSPVCPQCQQVPGKEGRAISLKMELRGPLFLTSTFLIDYCAVLNDKCP